MRKSILIGVAIVLLAGTSAASSRAWAGPWEDGMAAYNRGDYVPAIKLSVRWRRPAMPRRRT